jgi:hypothetical protein
MYGGWSAERARQVLVELRALRAAPLVSLSRLRA